jgi:hypothetical protein
LLELFSSSSASSSSSDGRPARLETFALIDLPASMLNHKMATRLLHSLPLIHGLPSMNIESIRSIRVLKLEAGAPGRAKGVDFVTDDALDALENAPRLVELRFLLIPLFCLICLCFVFIHPHVDSAFS